MDPKDAEILKRYRRDLLRVAVDESAPKIAAILASLEQRILRQIRRAGMDAATRAGLNRLTAQINRIVLDANPEVADWLRGELPKGAANALKTQTAYLTKAFGKASFDEIPVARITSAFRSWEEGIQAGRLIRIDDPAIFARWADLWNDQWIDTARGLQGRFTEAVARGESWASIVESITGPLGNLEISGRMNATDFARGFARAKLTEIANETSIQSSADAGLSLLYNQGVPDDRQSEICRQASAQSAMTIEEWHASIWGPPPRHVLNCRCQLMASVDDPLLVAMT